MRAAPLVTAEASSVTRRIFMPTEQAQDFSYRSTARQGRAAEPTWLQWPMAPDTDAVALLELFKQESANLFLEQLGCGFTAA